MTADKEEDMKKRIVSVLLAAAMVCTMAGCGSSGSTSSQGSSSAGKLVVVDWGGTNTDARTEAIIEPFEKETGIDVTVVTPSDYAKLISMVENGTTEWDVMNCDAYWGVYAGNEGYLEAIDYDTVTTKIDEEVQLDYVMGAEVYDSVIAWNTDKYSEDKAPQSWADFFNTSKYSGKRAMWKYPVTVLEAALLADGVAQEDLYPLDLDRAFAKLDTIKDSIVWWSAGAEPAQMLSTGVADIALAWSGRIATAADEGSPVAMNYNQALEIAAAWVVPKDCPNYENAMKFIEYASEAEQQLGFSKLIPYGSTNPDAVAMMDDDLKESLGQSEEQLANEMYIDSEYWAENLSAVEERFNTWLVE